MEKISSILPASPRTRSVDVSSAPALRPGTPSFGAPIGTTAALDRVSFSTAALDMEKSLPENWKDKDTRMAKIVDSVATNFFAAPTSSEPIVRSSGGQEQTLRNLQREQLRETIKPLAELRVKEFFGEETKAVAPMQIAPTAVESAEIAPMSTRPQISIRA